MLVAESNPERGFGSQTARTANCCCTGEVDCYSNYTAVSQRVKESDEMPHSGYERGKGGEGSA